MKKLLALLICALMLIVPFMASAESAIPALSSTTTATISLPSGEAFAVDLGTAANGDFVLKTNVQGGEYGLQIGPSAAYIGVSGLVLSVEYTEIESLISSLIKMGGSEIALPTIDLESTTALFTKIGETLSSMFNYGTDDAGNLVITADISMVDLWAACGDDIIAWANANTSLLEFACSNSSSEISVEDFLAQLEQVGTIADQADMHILVNGSAAMDSAIPTVALSVSATAQGSELFAVNFALDNTGVALEIIKGETKSSIAILFVDANTFTLMSNGTEVATLTLSYSDTAIEAITDGSDAIPLMSFLKMVGNS